MARNVEFKFTSGALREIMSWSAGEIESKGMAIHARANSMGKGTYGISSRMGKVSPHTIVFTDDFQARLETHYHNTLLKAFQ